MRLSTWNESRVTSEVDPTRVRTREAEGTAGLTRRHGRAALRGISRALALQQGYMLAQITEEIHAPDRAAQDAEEGGNSEYQDLGLEVDDDEVCVFLRCL